MYQLTEKDLEYNEPDYNPVIRAAENPNSAVLEAMLAYYEARKNDKSLSDVEQWMIADLSPSATMSPFGCFRSPIKSAMHIGCIENLRLLLRAGADPNGITQREIAGYSGRFIRGRDREWNTDNYSYCPRSKGLANARRSGLIHQICPLTEAELEERRRSFPVFWSEPIIPGQLLRMGRASLAIEDAAGHGNQEFVDMLRAAGAEESAWLQPESDNPDLWTLYDNAPVSALSTSSPVHEALLRGHRTMLRHLLSTCGYSPNYRPRAVPTMALPPLSHILVRCDLNNENVQNCLSDLLEHPQLDPNLRTPVFRIHPLHFAVAHHDPELLTRLAGIIPGGLAAAGTTALGHTLLHIACLPLKANQTIVKNPDGATSIHCARTLDHKYNYQFYMNPLKSKAARAADMAARKPHPLTFAQQQAQLATIEALLQAQAEAGKEGFTLDVRAEDVDGNTALHYLAWTRNMPEETIDLVRAMEGGEEVWHEAENLWGLTPSQLWGE
ncbi:hypothetical protein BJX63DRAFT_77080 [Aspergillus granulosus]|uniref:Uncharacterized protein n=1 Tax=Aspergillus granulosus TaxID=176169 RepID=A0ABR4GW66_9EURO